MANTILVILKFNPSFLLIIPVRLQLFSGSCVANANTRKFLALKLLKLILMGISFNHCVCIKHSTFGLQQKITVPVEFAVEYVNLY